MPEYEIQFATRYVKRQFQKAVGRSIVKVLTEPITNADDSYNLLAHRDLDERIGEIAVELDRRRRLFAVLDQAEGMDEQGMVASFVSYGAESRDRRDGAKTRSLFGKGLRDVLFTQEEGLVRSIKDGRSTVCKFRWRSKDGHDRPVVDVQAGPRVTEELRNAWGIVDNGTRVEFRLAANVAVPQPDRLARDLTNFYMLRRLSANPKRHLILKVRRAGSNAESLDIEYAPPAAGSTTHLEHAEWDFDFEDVQIRAVLDLSAFESPLTQGEQPLEDREGGLLVVDDDGNVLDLTLFGFNEDPGAARLFGELSLHGVGDLIRARLNSSQPEEILTETRDGFDPKHAFYKTLRAQVEPRLKGYVDRERRRLARELEGLSEETRKKHEQAFERLNAMYRQLLGESVGGGIGDSHQAAVTDLPLEFRPDKVILRPGVPRSLRLLVNTALIRPGTLIEVASSAPGVVELGATQIEVPQATVTGPTVAIGVAATGQAAGEAIVFARANADEASLHASVVDEDIPDLSAGMAFQPEELEIREAERAHLVLYVDLRVVGEPNPLTTESNNPRIPLLTAAPEWTMVTKYIVKKSVGLVGNGKGEEALISARIREFEALALVKVVPRRQQRDRRQGGVFRGYKFAVLERRVQAHLDSEGFVIVNLADPANALHFGKDVAAAAVSVETRADSQTLLAELVLGECLQRAVAEAYHGGRLRQRFPEDPTTDIRNYVSEKRFELGGEVHRLLVTRAARME